MDEIKASIDDIPSTIENTERWIEGHKDWSTINHFLVIGNGTNYGAVVEGIDEKETMEALVSLVENKFGEG